MDVIGNAQSVAISLVRRLCLMYVQRLLYVALSKVTSRNKIEKESRIQVTALFLCLFKICAVFYANEHFSIDFEIISL